jgi:hypothetical protein
LGQGDGWARQGRQPNESRAKAEFIQRPCADREEVWEPWLLALNCHSVHRADRSSEAIFNIHHIPLKTLQLPPEITNFATT